MADTTMQKREAKEIAPERVEQGTFFTPLVDVIETNDEFIFQADLPGVKPGEVDIAFENGVLTIEGKVQPRQPENHEYIVQEYGVGHFHRSFTLNTPVNMDACKAEMKNGVLELRIPKAESAKTRKIQIQQG